MFSLSTTTAPFKAEIQGLKPIYTEFSTFSSVTLEGSAKYYPELMKTNTTEGITQ